MKRNGTWDLDFDVERRLEKISKSFKFSAGARVCYNRNVENFINIEEG